MYVSITGNKNNQDVYIKHSYRKENGKTSSRIYKKLGKLNDLLEQFAGDKEKLMAWAKDQAAMETELYKQKNGKISVEFSQAAAIPLNEQRSFNVGYNAVSRLRKRACQIPDPIGKASTLDLTSHKQDVVQIAIEPETSPAELFQDERSSSMYLDNSHTIEIEAKGLTIRMNNTVQPMLLKILMDALKEPLC
jgi:hypothetical protein